MAPKYRRKRRFRKSSNGGTLTKEVGKGKTLIKNGNHKGVIVKGSYKASPNRIVYMSSHQQPFPPSYRTKLTASLYGNITSGSASGRYFVYLNSSYTPFAGGGWPNASESLAGYLPASYSSLINATLYNTVRVLGSRIKVEFLPQALTDTVIVAVTPSSNSSVPALVTDALDQRYAKQLFMSSSKMNSPHGSDITNYITQHKLLGVTSRAIQDDLSGNYTHTYNALPNAPLFWVVNWATPDAVNISSALEYKVTMTYYIEAYRNTLPQD